MAYQEDRLPDYQQWSERQKGIEQADANRLNEQRIADQILDEQDAAAGFRAASLRTTNMGTGGSGPEGGWRCFLIDHIGILIFPITLSVLIVGWVLVKVIFKCQSPHPLVVEWEIPLL